MEAYKEAKQQMFWRLIVLAVVISFTLLALLAFAGVVVFMLMPA